MSRSLKVLVCEDQPIVATALEDMIDQMGHQPIGPARSLAEALSLADMQSVEPRITQEVFGVLGVERSVESRTSYGGTAPDNVRAQAKVWAERLGL